MLYMARARIGSDAGYTPLSLIQSRTVEEFPANGLLMTNGYIKKHPVDFLIFSPIWSPLEP